MQGKITAHTEYIDLPAVIKFIGVSTVQMFTFFKFLSFHKKHQEFHVLLPTVFIETLTMLCHILKSTGVLWQVKGLRYYVFLFPFVFMADDLSGSTCAETL